MKIEASLAWRSPARGQLFESPVWCAASNSLYWVDVVDPSIHRHCFADGKSVRWAVPKPPGSIALIAPDRLLVAMRSALVTLDLASGTLAPLSWDGPQLEEDRFNDGVTDRHGNFWVGSMDRKLQQPLGRLFRFGAGGGGGLHVTVTPIGARLSNGLCFSPDGRRIYLSKTFEREIRSFEVDPVTGALSGERLLVAYDDTPGRPDGSTVAADGSLWSARIGAGRIDRYDADGKPLGFLPLPTSHPTHCMFGGADMKTLFVATSRFGEEFANQPKDDAEAGHMLGFRVEHAGLLPASFAHAGR
jgi:sugar lactone lactonase YvrE